MSEERRISGNLQTNLNEMERSSEQYNIRKGEADKYSNQKQYMENLGIGTNQDVTEKLVNYIANHKTRDGGSVYGREKALEFLGGNDNYNRTARNVLMAEFIQDMGSENIAAFKQGKSATNVDAANQRKNAENTNDGIKAFKTEVAKDNSAKYGKFNTESAKITTGQIERPLDKLGNPTSDVFQNTSKTLVTNSKLANENQLSISKNLSDKKTQDKYQNYTPQGSDMPVNIVDKVRTKNNEVASKVNQQEAAVISEKADLNKSLEVSASSSLNSKAMGVDSEAVKARVQANQDNILQNLQPVISWFDDKNKITPAQSPVGSNNNEVANNQGTTPSIQPKVPSNIEAARNTQKTSAALMSSTSLQNNTQMPQGGNPENKFVDLNMDRSQSISPKTFTEQKRDEKLKVERENSGVQTGDTEGIQNIASTSQSQSFEPNSHTALQAGSANAKPQATGRQFTGVGQAQSNQSNTQQSPVGSSNNEVVPKSNETANSQSHLNTTSPSIQPQVPSNIEAVQQVTQNTQSTSAALDQNTMRAPQEGNLSSGDSQQSSNETTQPQEKSWIEEELGKEKPQSNAKPAKKVKVDGSDRFKKEAEELRKLNEGS